ncbi:MAG: CHAT domain-containing protein [Xenococcaceae cyanobacterium MO_167.B27]|nr:CHAT domain-containing protein [Xenococcaceae cyanobacterium MO_167.B27]
MNKLPKLFLLFLITIALILSIQLPKIVLATNNKTLEQEAEMLYQQNRLSEAINLLETAIKQYQKQGDIIGSVIANRNLALIYQKLGEWEQAETTLSEAENIIITIETEPEKSQLLAQVLEVRGQIELSLGRSQNAWETWKQATFLYEQQGDIKGYTQAKIYQAYALQALGLYSQAIKTLTEVKDRLEKQPDTIIKAQALLSIGNVLTRVGKYQESATILESSLTIAEKLDNKTLIADTLINLGNNARLQSEPKQALQFYQQAIDLLPQSDIQLRGKLDSLDVLISLQEIETATKEAEAIKQLLSQLPPQKTTIQGQVSLARNLLKLDTKPREILPILVSAIKQAKSLGIKRVEADALGVLGHLYERNQQWEEAAKITEEALLIAQSINAKELTYQWQWQLGRILKAQDDLEGAIAVYTQATNNLQSLRSDLVAITSDIQYSFREKIEPVYRELATLLLQPGATQADLNQARNIIESLQVAELDNFFRDACLDTQPLQVDRLDPTAAIFYTIIIGNRLEVIAAIPGQPLRHYSNDLPPSEIEIVITSANSQISKPRRLNLKLLQQAYNWLIRPIEADLKNINTLVFVPDGILRNLPPATLHDGEQYLIEKYSIAIAPSLQLTQIQATQENRQEILLAGLSESRQGFSPLPGVKQEIQQIEPLFTSEVLLNNSFTEFNFNRSANETPFRIVHLATHGQFSSNPEDTFVLTWDERINIDELNSLIRGDSKQLRPVDLLVLSACETATGDRNSVLGLAGIAVRGGARSTIASLWAVNDQATVALMTNFYQELAKDNVTKAEALRRAQQGIIKSEKFSHPFYWSAFVLVGNWQ